MSVQFVAVPNGLTDDGGALIRVLVVPNLPPGRIDDMADWPTTIDNAEFAVITKTALGQEQEHQATYQSATEPAIWAEFFGGSAGNVALLDLATHPAPTVAPTWADAQHVVNTSHKVTTQLAAPATVLDQLQGWSGPDTAQPPDADVPVFRQLDFHRSVSMLRQHPIVLESLGLIFTVRVEQNDLFGGSTEPGFTLIAVRCPDPPTLGPAFVQSPFTRCEYGPTLFRPAAGSAASSPRGGMLDLSAAELVTPPSNGDVPVTPSWGLVTFDVDAATTALRSAAAKLAQNAVGDQAQQLSPPRIKSIGLGLLRPGRGADLADQAQRGAAPQPDELTSDDLILGYRVDIRTDGGAWLPLCERDASYTVKLIDPDQPDDNRVPLSIGGGTHREEGFVSPFSAVKVNDALYTDELVLRWEGWGLALPTIKLAEYGAPPAGPSGGDHPYDFEWDFAPPPGRLPMLRFGTGYQMRVRIADMAGGGLAFAELPDDTPQASPTVRYTRYDPISPPVLQSSVVGYAPGAGIDCMVIRSDLGLTPLDLFNADVATHQPIPYPATEQRQLLAPRSARLALIEQHAILDALTDQQSWDLAQRAMGTDPAQAGLPDPAAVGVTAYIGSSPGGLATDLQAQVSWTPAWPDPAWPDPQPKAVTLSAATAGASPSIAMAWSTDGANLAVILGQGEQALLQLSSPINAPLQNHFEAISWFAAPSDALTATQNGRNPAVSPPQRILCVHAVRRPLSDPQWQLTPADIQRTAGQTSVLLLPTFADNGPGHDGLNTDSTGQLDVAASWTDTVDSGSQAGAVTTPIAVGHVFGATIDPGPPPELQIRHEFGDTKHRTVTYTLNAITRYRQYFRVDEPDELFHAALDQEPVEILSAARPAPLTLLGAVPAFQWQPPQVGDARIDHVRLGGRVRVEVARPWFATGAGEQLAVLTAIAGAAPADVVAITRMGRDPLFGAPATPTFPAASAFTEAAASAETLTLPEIVDSQVTVVPYAVTPDGDRWYADIALTPAAMTGLYNPMIQLAVARYQPFSLPGLELSPPALADEVPVLPDRQVTVQRNGTGVTITVSGAAPNPPNPVVATLELAPGPDGEHVDLIGTDPAATAVPAWTALATVRGVVGSPLPTLTLPTPSTANGALRVRVVESEALPSTTASPGAVELDQRNVFVDTIALPPTWHG